MVRAPLHEREIRRVLGLPEEGELAVDGVAPLGAWHDRTLYFAWRPLLPDVRRSLAERRGCIVVVALERPVEPLGACRVLAVAEPRAALAKVLAFVRAERRQLPFVTDRQVAADAAISPLAVVEGAVRIDAGAVVEAFCTVGPEVVIGAHAVIRAGARIYPRVSIGEHSTVGPNSVIGYAGYGFVRDDAGRKTRIPHLGGVRIGSHVDIGALTVIQSGTIQQTIIDDNAKIDDNVEIGHNVYVGRSASLTGGVVLAGSSIVGAEAWVGINSSLKDGRRIGEWSLVGMDSSVQQDVPDGTLTRGLRPQITRRPDPDNRRGIGFAERRPAKK